MRVCAAWTIVEIANLKEERPPHLPAIKSERFRSMPDHIKDAMCALLNFRLVHWTHIPPQGNMMWL